MVAISQDYKRFTGPNRVIARNTIFHNTHRNPFSTISSHPLSMFKEQSLVTFCEASGGGQNHHGRTSPSFGSVSTAEALHVLAKGQTHPATTSDKSAIVGRLRVSDGAVSGVQVVDGRNRRDIAGPVAACLYNLDNKVSDMEAWQASLEYELNLARLMEKEKGSTSEVADQAVAQVIELFSMGQALADLKATHRGLSLTPKPDQFYAPPSCGLGVEEASPPHQAPSPRALHKPVMVKEPKEEGLLHSWKGKEKGTRPASLGIRHPDDIVIGKKRQAETRAINVHRSSLLVETNRIGEDELVGFDSQPLAAWVKAAKKFEPLRVAKKKKKGHFRERKGHGNLSAGAHWGMVVDNDTEAEEAGFTMPPTAQ